LKARALLAALAVLSALSCATPSVQVERRPDGILHVSCQSPLPQCLAVVEKTCDYQRYAVLRAFDDRNRKGDTVAASLPELAGDLNVSRSSEAFVRCDRNAAWSIENKALRKAPLGNDAATAPLGCMPGAAVACVGAGGCRGGQVCAPDGSKLGPCDCGPAEPASPPQTSPTP
jgi:hypothetical protein